MKSVDKEYRTFDSFIKSARMLLFIFVVTFVVLEVNTQTAAFIHPCNLSDTPCLISSAQAAIIAMAPGVPALGLEPLDPLTVATIKGDSGGLNLEFRNTVVTGLKDCTVEAIKVSPTKPKQSFTTRCSVTLRGDYTLHGRVILLPVEGEGKFTIDIHDIVIKAVSEMSKVQGPDGKVHYKVNSWKHSYQVLTDANFQFDNLFNGNKILANPVEQFLNSNWNDVMNEVAPPIVRAIVAKVYDIIGAFYEAVPVDELQLN